MNKKSSIKIAIVALSVAIIVITIILLIFNMGNPNQIEDFSQDEIKSVVNNETVEQIAMTSDYFVVKEILEKFYSNCEKLNLKAEDIDVHGLSLTGEELQKHIEQGIQREEKLAEAVIYGLLDKSYASEFRLEKDDIKQKFQLENKVEMVIEKMYRTKSFANIFIYFVYGTYRDTTTNESTEINLMIVLDMANKTFSVYPEEYLKKYEYDKIEEGNKVDISIESIENNGYNTFQYSDIVEDNTIAKEYFYNYKNTMLCNQEKAYAMLDKEYREEKFDTLEKYKKYVEENYDKLKNLLVTKYQVVESSGTKEYICLDQNDKYYIFKVINEVKYTLILDTYTIDLPEFTEKYNKASEQEKVALNINKVITALNEKDYKYIYSKLADSFKNNYFKDEESLKEYLVNNLFDKNIVEFEEFAREGTLYTYKIKLTKIISEDEKEKYYGKNAPMTYMNIVMQLNEGTDFVMSFSIEE
ncbi:MAG: hypothetical protein ACI4VH_02645 [Clostridia bacterium]